VLYTKIDEQHIWRLTSDPYRIGSPTRVAPGIAVHPAPGARAFAYRPPTGSSIARVGIMTTLAEFGSVSFLLTLTPENRVDAVLIGSLLTPLLTGSGIGDTTAIGERLVGMWQRGDEKGLCAELHPGLRLSASIFG